MNIATPFRRPSYEHRQTGWAMLAIACLPPVYLGISLLLASEPERTAPMPLLIGVCVVTAFVVFNFTSLELTVTPDHLIARFGIGLVRKTIALADVADVEVTRTRWYEGWGIHWTRRGMLYNVAGFDAVQVHLANGRTMTFGSDDAPRLATAVRRALDERRVRRSVS